MKSGKKKILHKNLNAGGEYFGRVGECSTGFRTKVNGQVGFVTAGHCVKSAKTGYIAENLGVGTVVLSTLQFDAGQKYDYVFVATNSSNTPTNILQYSSGNIRSLTVVNYCPIITVNMEIAKSGITTGYTSGKVKGLNEKIKVKDDNKETIGYIYGLVKTSAKCDSGDSGAVVFIPRTDANGGSIPIGILSGGDPGTFGFINPQMFFTDISDMPSEFVMGRY